MSLQQRTRNLNIADQENPTKQVGKQVTSKSIASRRPALCELGNNTINSLNTKTLEAKQAPFKKPVVTKGLPRAPLVATKKVQKVVSVSTLNIISKKNVDAIVPKPNNKKTEVKLTKPHKCEISESTSQVVSEEIVSNNEVLNFTNDDETDEEVGYSSKQLAGVIDVDINDKNDPFLVSEYIQDICAYLHSMETKFKIKENYLENHRSNASMRSILINWMVDVHTNFKFVLETLHLSVGILDRYLQVNSQVGRETLQLVGSAAMIIASKYEEIHLPDISDFVYLCDNTYSQTEMLQMEKDILRRLKLELGRPLSIHFLRRYSKIAAILPEHHNLAKYLLEICLIEYKLCHINPSIQAAAALCLSMCILGDIIDPNKVWSKTIIHYTNYKYLEIEPTVKKLAYFILKTEKSKLKAIPKKYSVGKFGKVSILPQLNGEIVCKFAEEGQAYLKIC